MKAIIRFATYRVEAQLYDTPTGRAVYDALPIQQNVNRWGDEIYFGIDLKAELEEGARAEVSEGELGYWPNMPAFCIFFGATPLSKGNEPVAASAVNVFGRLVKVEPDVLRRIPDGENVTVERPD